MYLGTASLALLARNVLDLDDLGAHEPSLLPMPHQVHLPVRPYSQYLKPLVLLHFSSVTTGMPASDSAERLTLDDDAFSNPNASRVTVCLCGSTTKL